MSVANDLDGSKSDFVFVPPKVVPPNTNSAFQIDLATFLLGPFCGALWLFLYHIGFPPLFNIFMMALMGFIFAYREEMSLELIVRLLTRLIVHVFFREINSRNAYKIPQEGPVIFVCAPHANQFLDPAVMMEFVPRPVSFLIAAKSYRQRIVGALARGQRSIPVERPQDLAVSCPGRVTVRGVDVTGTGTKFSEILRTDSLLIAGEVIKVDVVHSDTHLTLKTPHPNGDCTNVSYKRAPKIDQHQVFGNVWETLAAGNCVGIFPEGGSHDRSELLPLKAGVAIMALGAAAKYPGLNVKLVTVGLNYFHGHRFRGRCYVEYGDPFSLPPELVEQYRQGGEAKVKACNTLLDMIKDQLRTVTVSAPSWEQLQLLWAVRRLYQPSGVKLPPKLAVVLIRRFAEGYDKVKDRPEVKAIAHEVNEYNKTLRLYGLRDHQVPVTRLSRSAALVKLISRLVRLVLIAVFAVPGTLLNLPILVMTRFVSRKKATEALQGSSVKVAARDVLASWKVLVSLSMVPLVLIVYPSLAALVGWMLGLPLLHTWGNFAVMQPFMMWAAVRSTETFWDIARSIKPLFFAVMDRGSTKIADIRDVRKTLKSKIRALVDELGPQLYGPQFQSLRIFTHRRHGDDADVDAQVEMLNRFDKEGEDGKTSGYADMLSLVSSREAPPEEGMGDADDAASHVYHEEKELVVPHEVMRRLATEAVPVGEEYEATLGALALAPLDMDATTVASDGAASPMVRAPSRQGFMSRTTTPAVSTTPHGAAVARVPVEEDVQGKGVVVQGESTANVPEEDSSVREQSSERSEAVVPDTTQAEDALDAAVSASSESFSAKVEGHGDEHAGDREEDAASDVSDAVIVDNVADNDAT